jgi:hypothetical protein
VVAEAPPDTPSAAWYLAGRISTSVLVYPSLRSG